LPGRVTARTVHALGLSTLAASVKGRKLARVYPRKYQELVKARLRNIETSYRVSSQTAAQAVQYLRELTHYARVNLAQENDKSVLNQLARTYHLRPPDDPEVVSNLHTQLWEILRDGVALALEGLYDYTDMIYAPVQADLSPTQRFDIVCVDEAQDLSPMQLSFILRLPRPGGRLLFVGDPKQAIYGFAGGDTRAMSRIVERTQAAVLPLSVTYRCPQKHVRLAQRFAPAIQAAPGAVEGRVTAIPEGALPRYVNPGDLVLCRINAPLVETCLELIQRAIPAQVLGRDIAGKLVSDAKLVFKQGLEDWKVKLKRLEAREVEGIKQAKLPQDVTKRMVYRREDELACLRAVVEDAVRGGVTTLKGLETRIDGLFGDASGMVTLSTVHRAKGREADNVFILLPHLMPLPNAETPEEREAEDCVRFVAVTRAKHKLVFVESIGSTEPYSWWRDSGVKHATYVDTAKVA
jgi:DNA helicase-2/ATP-dependent DNA helicase PcrA